MKRTALVIVAFLCAHALQAGGIKKWIDADGKVHFGDAPPPEQKTRRIQVRDPATGNGSMIRPDVLLSRQTERKRSHIRDAEPSRDYGERLRYRNAAIKGDLLAGMSKSEARKAWGKPDEVDFTAVGGGEAEQWWYWDHSGTNLKHKVIRFRDGLVSSWGAGGLSSPD